MIGLGSDNEALIFLCQVHSLISEGKRGLRGWRWSRGELSWTGVGGCPPGMIRTGQCTRSIPPQCSCVLDLLGLKRREREEKKKERNEEREGCPPGTISTTHCTRLNAFALDVLGL